MKNDDLTYKLNTLESKLDKLITQSNPEISSPYTLHEWLNKWYAIYKAPTLSEKWLSVLRCCMKRIQSAMIDKPLNQYTAPELLQDIYSVPLSCTRQNVYNVLKMAYSQAAILGYVISNPMDGVPPVKHKRQFGQALTLDQQRQFLEIIQNNERRTLYLFYLLSGCRCSEVLTLKWSDIDNERKQIHIHGTKTPKADRYIPLFPQISALLAQMPRDGERVFPLTNNGVKSHFQRLKHKHGLNFRLHDLRHTFATRCLESGISLPTVSKWLGHASVGITAQIYIHILTEFERAEAARFNPQI